MSNNNPFFYYRCWLDNRVESGILEHSKTFCDRQLSARSATDRSEDQRPGEGGEEAAEAHGEAGGEHARQ